MMATGQDFADLNKILNARGYLVLLTGDEPFSPGEFIPDSNCDGRPTGQPLMVVCETDYADYAAQCAVVGWEPAYLRGRLYRVVTD